jgi:hypothetical protein
VVSLNFSTNERMSIESIIIESSFQVSIEVETRDHNSTMTTNLPPPGGPYKIPSKMTRQQSRRRRQQESYMREPKRIYASPRISQDDAELFPKIEALQNSTQRWNYISEQAGKHRQDGSVLTLGRCLTPSALKAGITSQVASRVKHLNLWLDPNEDSLPEWLDVVASLFINIEHLTLAEELLIEDKETTVSARMRRLYVLYRLPDLKSIDDMAITRVERKMARPKTAEGEKVERKDWVSKSDALLDNDKDGFRDVAEEDNISTEGMDTDSTISSSSEFITESQMLPPCTPRDNGVEISKSLLDSITDDFVASDKYARSDVAGEQREDSSSNSATNDNRDSSEREPQDRIMGASLADALELDLDGEVQYGEVEDEDEDETPIMRLRRTASHCSASEEEKPGGLSLAPTHRGLTSMDTLEIVTVASSHHEFTLACGALSFGSRSCNPARMICGAGGSSSKSKEDQRNETKLTLRLNREKLLLKVSTPSRQPTLVSPHFATEVVRDGSFGAVKFFPSEGESEPHNVPRHGLSPRHVLSPCLSPRNENITDSPPKNRLPPSKSLASPFPMQFRERPKPSLLHVATERFDEENQPTPKGPKGCNVTTAMATIMSPIPLSRINSSPPKLSSPTKAASRGELPPQCPGARRRLVVTTAMTPLRSRKAKRILKRIKQSKHNARSTSVMDMEEDDESEDEGLGEEEEDIFDFEQT